MPGGAANNIRGLGTDFGHRRDGELVPGAPLPELIGTGDWAKDLAQIAKDMHALRRQFVLEGLLEKTLINLAASGDTLVVNSLTREVGSIIVTVTAGTLSVWIGERSGVIPGTIPDLQFTVTGAPTQIVLPPSPRIFTLLADGAPVTGTFILSSI
jgi:hypothetical protein